MSYPSLQEQDVFLQAKRASGKYMICPAMGGSEMPKETCRNRQKAKTVYRYRPDRAFAGENLYLECKGCTENKTPKRIRHVDNGAWKKTRRCENRIDTWARAEGFTSTLEAVLCVTRDIWHGEVAAMCGVSYCFFHNWAKKRQIPMRSRSETNKAMRKNLRIERWRNDKRSISKKNRRAIRQA